MTDRDLAPDLVPAKLAPLLLYWRQKCAGRAMPCRADIDPAELVRYLSTVMIVDVVADARRFVYRLVGTREVEARGRDPTGQPVGEAFFGSSRDNVLANYDRVLASRRPHFDASTVIRSDDRKDSSHVIFLPLSEDGVAVSQILVYTAFEF